MRIKIFIVLFIIATVGLSFRTVIGRTPVSDNTKVQEALADSLNDNGRWTKQHYVEGAAQPTPPSGTAVIYFKTDGKPYSKDDAGTESDLAGVGTIDGIGTTNELVYWVDSNTVGALAVATYPSLAELAHGKGVTSAIQTQFGLKAPLASPTFTTQIITPLAIGGTATTADLTLQTTSGVGATGADMHFLVGNNGATEAVTILNSGKVGITTTNPVTKFQVGIGNTSADTAIAKVNTFDTDVAALELSNWDGAAATYGPRIHFDNSGVGNWYIGSSDGANNFDIATTWGTPLLRIASTGVITLQASLTGVLRADTGVVSVDTDVTDLVTAASSTAAGKSELAIASEINTGTDTTRTMPIDQYVASNRNVRYLALRVVEAATDVAVATTKGGDFEMRFAGTITGIGAYNDTAGTTGTMTIDANKAGTTLMTTNKITIDTAEKSSLTAATAPALTTTAVAAGDLITIDIDAIHTTAAKGLTVWLSIRMD